MRPDGSGLRRLTSGRFDDHPSFSADGRRIVFQSLPRVPTRGCTDGAIYVMRVAGGHARLVPHTNGGVDPGFTPDGRHVVFAQGGRVVISRLDGTRRHRLARGSAPAVSADGSRIAYIRGRGMRGDVAVMALDGTSRRVLRHNRVFDDNPAWSPDGTRIAYDSVRGDDQGVYVIDLAAGREHRAQTHALEPAWLP
jgi:Tol biopolymer transport system component